MAFESIIENMIERSEHVIPRNEGDYIGEDGLLYCGNCHTRKQTEIEVFGKKRRPYCLCKCEMQKKEEQEKAEKEAIKQKEFQEQVKKMRSVGFPEGDKMANWTFENDDMANKVLTEAMKNYVANFKEMQERGKGLLLWGEKGTGKTFAACEVANALIDKGYPVLATNFARLTNTLQGMYEGKQDYIDNLNKFALLVIDDLGAERKTDFMQEMVWNIVDSRSRAGLPMIITTNLTIDEIKNPDGIGCGRIYDRIIERCHPINVKGVNRRKKKAGAEYLDMQKLLGLTDS